MTTNVALQALAVDEDTVAPGLLGFLVVALIGLATWLLIRSMNRQLRKIDFEERDTDERVRGNADRGGRPRADGEPADRPERGDDDPSG